MPSNVVDLLSWHRISLVTNRREFTQSYSKFICVISTCISDDKSSEFGSILSFLPLLYRTSCFVWVHKPVTHTILKSWWIIFWDRYQFCSYSVNSEISDRKTTAVDNITSVNILMLSIPLCIIISCKSINQTAVQHNYLLNTSPPQML
jgi:hypothetical protein